MSCMAAGKSWTAYETTHTYGAKVVAARATVLRQRPSAVRKSMLVLQATWQRMQDVAASSAPAVVVLWRDHS
jgi:hypothetical protein